MHKGTGPMYLHHTTHRVHDSSQGVSHSPEELIKCSSTAMRHRAHDLSQGVYEPHSPEELIKCFSTARVPVRECSFVSSSLTKRKAWKIYREIYTYKSYAGKTSLAGLGTCLLSIYINILFMLDSIMNNHCYRFMINHSLGRM